MLCEDWELWQSWRRWWEDYPDPEEHWDKIFNKFYTEMTAKKDLYFILGTHFRFPQWIIIGLYYPPVKPPEPPKWGDLQAQRV